MSADFPRLAEIITAGVESCVVDWQEFRRVAGIPEPDGMVEPALCRLVAWQAKRLDLYRLRFAWGGNDLSLGYDGGVRADTLAILLEAGEIDRARERFPPSSRRPGPDYEPPTAEQRQKLMARLR